MTDNSNRREGISHIFLKFEISAPLNYKFSILFDSKDIIVNYWSRTTF